MFLIITKAGISMHEYNLVYVTHSLFLVFLEIFILRFYAYSDVFSLWELLF